MKDMTKIIKCLDSHITKHGAIRQKVSIVAIHTLYPEHKSMDIEVLVTINKAIPSNRDFVHRPNFKLKKCLLTKYRGDFKLLPELIIEIYNQAMSMGLKVRHPFYVVTKQCPTSVLSLWVQEIDVYVKVASRLRIF